MFGSNSGKSRGSLRKTLYKQLTRPNTSASENSTPSHNEAKANNANDPKPRPPALTFSGPSNVVEKCSGIGAPNSMHISAPAGIDGTSLPPAYPKIRSAPAESKTDPNSLLMNRPRFSSVRAYNPADSLANTPLVENTPLSVDVTCECGISAAQSQSDPPSTRSLYTPGQIQLLHPNCRVPGHQHYRSISASPQYATGTTSPNPLASSNAPLLIPLGNSQFL